MILAFDPGLRVAGAALFDPDSKQLVRAALIKNPEKVARDGLAWAGMAQAVHTWVGKDVVLVKTLVMEIPQVYKGAAGYGVDSDDLIQLAGVDGAVAGLWPEANFTGYRPREWKKTVPKQIMCDRIERALKQSERDAIEPCAPSLRHNIIDSCGIGCHYLGRRL